MLSICSGKQKKNQVLFWKKVCFVSKKQISRFLAGEEAKVKNLSLSRQNTEQRYKINRFQHALLFQSLFSFLKHFGEVGKGKRGASSYATITHSLQTDLQTWAPSKFTKGYRYLLFENATLEEILFDIQILGFLVCSSTFLKLTKPGGKQVMWKTNHPSLCTYL